MRRDSDFVGKLEGRAKDRAIQKQLTGSESFLRGLSILRGDYDVLRKLVRVKKYESRFDHGFEDFDDTKDEQP